MPEGSGDSIPIPTLPSSSTPRYNARMNAALKIIKIGNSAGIILSKELLAHLGAGVGDHVQVLRTSRGLEISVANSDADDQMATAREVMKRRHRALMALANEIMDQDHAILADLAKS